MSVLQAFIMGNNIDSIVEFGCFAGFSTLLIGYMMKKMQLPKSFVSIDITKRHCEITQEWTDKAELNEYIKIIEGSSHDPKVIQETIEFLPQKPKLIIIDSSHQYQQTLNELNAWFGHLQTGGFIFLHDTSVSAAEYDTTNQGGVNRAFKEWTKNRENIASININPNKYEEPIYFDGTGLGIIQKK